MWRNKKFILIGLLVVVVLGGTLGGIAAAQADDNVSNNTIMTLTDNSTRLSTLLEKVAVIYQQNTGVAIDAEQLAEAFKQATQEMCNNGADKFLDKLVEKGTITQDQADKYKSWLDARPDIPITPGIRGRLNGMGKLGGMFRHWDTDSGDSN